MFALCTLKYFRYMNACTQMTFTFKTYYAIHRFTNYDMTVHFYWLWFIFLVQLRNIIFITQDMILPILEL